MILNLAYLPRGRLWALPVVIDICFFFFLFVHGTIKEQRLEAVHDSQVDILGETRCRRHSESWYHHGIVLKRTISCTNDRGRNILLKDGRGTYTSC